MKKILLFLFATLCFQGTINAQYKTFRKNVYVKFKNYENVSTKLETTIDSINFKFEPDIVLPIFRQGLTSINSEQERGGSRLGLTLFRPCT